MEPIPTTIGRYVVENLVGAGGMGRIYKAHDPDIRRTVAIKLISTKLMSGSDRAEYIRRFRREAEAAARCAHPNIVAVYDFAIHEGQPFLAMEFIYGQSLRELLDDTPVIAVPEAIAIMLQVLDALASAHAQGVIHQDIKPANIMLTPEKRVKVGDFGISRFVNTEVTTVFSTIGTPSYMSPEQCRGDNVDGRSDLFSAGATLFEMVAGERAFQGRNATEVSYHIRNDQLPLLPIEVRTAVPRLQLVLERAMAKQPEDRFDSSADMAAALRQVLVGGPDDDAADSTRIEAAAPAPGAATTLRRDLFPRTTDPPLDSDTLQGLEDKLRPYVGPLARALVRAAASRSHSAEELGSELARSVDDDTDRARFRREVALLLRSRAPPAGPPSLGDDDSRSGTGSSSGSLSSSSGGRGRASGGDRLPEQELERAQAALTQFVGPIARILVRRAAANASTVEAFWQALSTHIESPTERSAFLRQRQK
jgi:eukaryotic-like serine/threonine-protein kinase